MKPRVNITPANGRVPVRKILIYGFFLFSSAYLVDIRPSFLESIGLNASPIYLWTVIGTFAFLLYIILARDLVRLNLVALSSATMCFYLSITQPLLKPQINALSHLIMSFFYAFVVSVTYRKPTDKDKLIETIFLYVNLLFLTLDAFYRIGSFEKLRLGFLSLFTAEKYFYTLKTNSLMFGDSNLVGFLAVSLYVFAKYLDLQDKKMKKAFFLTSFFVFSLLSFSRAIYFVLAIFIILEVFEFFLKKKAQAVAKLLELLCFIYLVVFTFWPEFFNIIDDGSFQTKIFNAQIARKFFTTWNSVYSVIGIGAGNAMFSEEIGMWMHNLLSVFIVETGYLGFALFMFFLWSLIRETGNKFPRFFILLFLAGVSFVPYGIPYFYVMILYLNVRSRTKNHTFNTEVS